MAKVKIQGHASGTGILTVTAPNTSTDRTITLPDSTDTLAVNSDVTNKLPLAGGTMTGKLVINGTNTASVTNAATLAASQVLSVNSNSGEGSDNVMIGAMSDGTGDQFIEATNSGGGASYKLHLNPINGGDVVLGGGVGIGTSSPEGKIEINDGSYAKMVLDVTGSKAFIQTSKWDGSNPGRDLVIQTKQSDGETARFLADGGLTFNGDTAAANALSDYEEGTWTPAAGGGGTAFSAAYGTYTKIGNRVFCQFKVVAGNGSTTGDWTGLPFTIRNASNLGVGGGSVAYQNSSSGECWNVSCENANTTQWSLRRGADQKQLVSSKQCWGAMTYLV
jgi:hypothetical protein